MTQNWTWWQQLIGVELLILLLALLWYYCVQIYYETKFKQLNIPFDYIDYSFNSLIEPGKYMFQFIMIVIASIMNGASTRTRFINIMVPFSLCFINSIYFTSPINANPDTKFYTLLNTIILASFSFIIAKHYTKFQLMFVKEDVDPRLFWFRIYFTSGVVSLLMVVPLAIMFSGYTVTKTSWHYVIEQNKETKVVLDTYKDYYITAPVNIKRKTFKPEFELIPMHKDDKDPPVIVVKDTNELNQAEKQEEKIVLKYMEIGPLKPENPSEP
ncbi:hypothetical protein SAMN06265361_102462 [Laceyella tengchongensis]|uniref:Uncharacterized protein n=3 Tax=Laceyella TaxID=292635 RepID=A0AA45WM48_9BACL|nr:hypothetical protein SAMN06265361_102462 [Laceyella tengchongensis]